MDQTLRDQQSQWRDTNRPWNPASEGELLDPERALGHLLFKNRPRILGLFTFKRDTDGTMVPLDELLQSQQRAGVKVVGAVSTILGQEGLLAQCLRYKDCLHDWFWVSITDILRIEVREDSRFRGGTRCIWLTTAIAEYAMTIPHPTYIDCWESALVFFNAPHLDVVSLDQYRPDWWPDKSAGMWPGHKRPDETSHIISPAEELRRLTEQLSVDPGPSRDTQPRLGNFDDPRRPGQPSHHLDQLLPWELKFDGGRKVMHTQRGGGSTNLQGEKVKTSSNIQGAKRKPATEDGRRVRWRKQ